MIRIIAVIAAFVACLAGPIGVEHKKELLDLICNEELTSAGFTHAFPHNVAHRLHSITVEDIARYFGAVVGEKNGIPTVNKDLSSEQRVLEDAPKGQVEQRFVTDALQKMDMVLSKMDDESFEITNFSTLEKLAHALHMDEMWARAGTHYAALLLQPPSHNTCKCVRYSTEKQVLQALHLMALKIKYPGVTSGEYEKLRDNGEVGYKIHYSVDGAEADAIAEQPAGYDIHYGIGETDEAIAEQPAGYKIHYSVDGDEGEAEADQPAGYEIHYGIGSVDEFQKKLKNFDFSGDEEDVVKRVAGDFVDNDHGMAKKLDNQEGWAYWKEKMIGMKEDGNVDFAVYMYCKLQK